MGDTTYTIGHFSISMEVGSELVVRALRRVVESGNLKKLEVDRDVAVDILKATVMASFLAQKGHFVAGRGGLDGGPGNQGNLRQRLAAALDQKDGQYSTPKAHSVGKGVKGKELMLSLFNWALVVHRKHNGTLFASSDGYGVHLKALDGRDESGPSCVQTGGAQFAPLGVATSAQPLLSGVASSAQPVPSGGARSASQVPSGQAPSGKASSAEHVQSLSAQPVLSGGARSASQVPFGGAQSVPSGKASSAPQVAFVQPVLSGGARSASQVPSGQAQPTQPTPLSVAPSAQSEPSVGAQPAQPEQPDGIAQGLTLASILATLPAPSGTLPFVAGGDFGKGSCVFGAFPLWLQTLLDRLATAQGELKQSLDLLDVKREESHAAWGILHDFANSVAEASVWGEQEQAAVLQLLEYDSAIAAVRTARAAVKDLKLTEVDAREIENLNHHKGVECITKGLKKSQLQESHQQAVRDDRLKVFNKCLREGQTVESLQLSVKSLNKSSFGRILQSPGMININNNVPVHNRLPVCDSVPELAAIRSHLRVYCLLQIAHSSGAVRQQRRAKEKYRRNFVANTVRLVTLVHPNAVCALPVGSFLEKSLPFPKRSPQSRQRERRDGWKRNTHQPIPAVTGPSSNTSESDPKRVAMFWDLFSTKGQKTTSTFGFAQMPRAMCSYINSRPALAQKITIRIVNGYRTSRQAAGVYSFLSNANRKRNDHRKVKETDLKPEFKGPMLSDFDYFWCPITKRVLNRNPVATQNCSLIGHCEIRGAPRPLFLSPETDSHE